MQHPSSRRTAFCRAWLPVLGLLSLPGTLLAQEAPLLCASLTPAECRSLLTRDVFALFSDNSLYRMYGSKIVSPRRLTILSDNTDLIGIDFRPADPNSSDPIPYGFSDTGKVFHLTQRVSEPSRIFEGGYQSLVDFNPVADALRVIGSNNQNVIVFSRDGDLNVAQAQTDIAYVAGDPQAGRDANLTAGAYSNNVPRAATTTFFALDYTYDTLVTTADVANGSSNTSTGRIKTIGRLVNERGNPINIRPEAGMDIYTDPTVGNIAIIANTKTLYFLNLSSVNAAQSVGSTKDVVLREINPDPFGFEDKFGRGPGAIIDVAVNPAPVRPSASDLAIAYVGVRDSEELERPFVNGARTFSVEVTNRGPDAQPNTMLSASNFPFNSVVATTSRGRCEVKNNQTTDPGVGSVNCNLGTLAAGQSATVSVTVTKDNISNREQFFVRFNTNGPLLKEVINQDPILIEDPDPSNNVTRLLKIPVVSR